jgi:hypothetical protein
MAIYIDFVTAPYAAPGIKMAMLFSYSGLIFPDKAPRQNNCRGGGGREACLIRSLCSGRGHNQIIFHQFPLFFMFHDVGISFLRG